MPLSTADRATRAGNIGASEVPVLYGCDPYRTVGDLIARKKYDVTEPETDAQRLGHYAEVFLATWYAEQYAPCTLLPSPTLVYPDMPRLVATPDRIVHKGASRHLLEAKARRNLAEFGAPGTAEVPQAITLQVTATMGVAKAHGIVTEDVSEVVVGSVLTERPAIYTVPFDAALFADIVSRVQAFAVEYLDGSTLPPGVAVPPAAMAARHPQAETTVRDATPEHDALMTQYGQVRRQLALLERSEAELKTTLQEIIGEWGGMVGAAGKVTWNTVAGRRSTDYTGLMTALRAQLPPEHLPLVDRLIAAHQVTGRPSRRFLWSER
jgi:predicted phage-related endonuclease